MQPQKIIMNFKIFILLNIMIMTKSIILKYLTKINLCASKSLSSILSCYKNNSDRIVTTETRVIKKVSLLNDLNITLMN